MNLTVKNNLGEQFSIVAVRYFKFNGANYLIFTKNEIDDAGYQKLYISKINNMIGTAIADDIEWKLVSDTIKVIAKANKENTALPIQDLNESEINGIQIIGQKPFKITTQSVALLGANKNVQQVIATQPIENATPVTPIIQQPVTPVYSESVVSPIQQNIINPVDNMGVNMQPTMAQNMTAGDFNPIMPNPVSDVVNTVVSPIDVQPLPQAMPSEVNNASINESFNFTIPTPATPAQQTDFGPTVPATETIDYKKLYEEQTLKVNTLTAELEKYKSLIEQLKTILN